MALEDEARERIDAEDRSLSMRETPATVSDIPKLEELLHLVSKHRVPPIGLYAEPRPMRRFFGVGTRLDHYVQITDGWAFVQRGDRDSGDSVELLVTRDGDVYVSARLRHATRTSRGLRPEDAARGTVVVVDESSRAMLWHANTGHCWRSLPAAAEAVIRGAGSAGLVLLTERH